MRTELSSDMKPKASSRLLAISWGLAFGIILIAVNMRAPLTAVGPLVGTIRDELALSNTWAGMLTTLPLAAFALFSLAAPWLVRRFSMEWVLMTAVVVLTAGIALRSVFGAWGLFAGTLLVGTGISVCNVLLPGLVKREFPQQVGLVTGMYLVSMNIFAALGSGLSIPMAFDWGLGWQGALGIWALFGVIAIIVWLPQFRRSRSGTAAIRAAGGSGKKIRMWRSLLAWQVTVFMGLQSFVFYVMITWVPEILVSRGMDMQDAGWVLSIMLLALTPFMFGVPIIAGRLRDQRILVYLTALLASGGTIGILYGSLKTAWFWVMILGVSTAIAFGTALMFFTLRTRTAQQAAELSGMAQAVGYLLAATGPAFLGYLYDASGNWTIPVFVLLGVIILMFVAGLGSGKRRYVGDADGDSAGKSGPKAEGV